LTEGKDRLNSPGRDPLDEQWVAAFSATNGRLPSDVDRQDRLFSLMFPGEGADGQWGDEEWDTYRGNRAALWSGELAWPAGDMPHGYDRFDFHIRRLAGQYGPGRQAATGFTRAAGLIWGGIAYEGSAFVALFEAGVGRHLAQLQEGSSGWRPEHVDDNNPAHHWVAAFVAGFAYGAFFGALTNSVRDVAQFVTRQGGTLADIRLGNVAAGHGALLRRASRRVSGQDDAYYRVLDQMNQDLRWPG
jgi:hypothetical protein